MQKILFVAPSAYPLGGVQTWLDYLIPGLQERGFEVAIALSSGHHHDHAQYLTEHPFDAVEIVANPSGTIQGRINALQEVFLRLNPSIIVNVNIADVFQAVANLRQNKNFTAKVVSTIHGIHPGLIADVDHYHEVIDAVISTNKLTQKLIIGKTNMEPGRCLYAPYGVTPAADSQPDCNGLTIAYVGRIEEDQKRFSDLMAIFERALVELPTARFLIAGDGDQLPNMEAWLQEVNIDQRIDYLGVLTQQELSTQVYDKSDVLLLTSFWETGPIVVWEAMTHGVAVVSSKYLGHLEEGSLQDGQNCLLFDIGDIEAAVQKLKRIESSELRRSLVTNAHQLIAAKYTRERSAQSWADCLNAVLQLPAKGASRTRPIELDRGRLTATFGMQMAEIIRALFKISTVPVSAGAEWPHCYSKVNSDSSELIDYIQIEAP